jgi:molybdopterin-binding protein
LLVGRIVDAGVSGLVAQVTLSVGGQLIPSLITSRAWRAMQLEEGTNRSRSDQSQLMIMRV